MCYMCFMCYLCFFFFFFFGSFFFFVFIELVAPVYRLEDLRAGDEGENGRIGDCWMLAVEVVGNGLDSLAGLFIGEHGHSAEVVWK